MSHATAEILVLPDTKAKWRVELDHAHKRRDMLTRQLEHINDRIDHFKFLLTQEEIELIYENEGEYDEPH